MAFGPAQAGSRQLAGLAVESYSAWHALLLVAECGEKAKPGLVVAALPVLCCLPPHAVANLQNLPFGGLSGRLSELRPSRPPFAEIAGWGWQQKVSAGVIEDDAALRAVGTGK